MSQEEVAEAMGVSVSSAKRYIVKAEAHLAETLGDASRPPTETQRRNAR
jgi:DNA-directed RNA polymerase specialized sigma24 family protein